MIQGLVQRTFAFHKPFRFIHHGDNVRLGRVKWLKHILNFVAIRVLKIQIFRLGNQCSAINTIFMFTYLFGAVDEKYSNREAVDWEKSERFRP